MPDGNMKKKILIVDDDPTITRLIKTALENPELEFDLAHNRHTAEKMAENTDYDLVLCDIFLPDTRELEFVDFLRDKDLDYNIILMSGYMDAEGYDQESDEVYTVNRLTLLAGRKGVNTILKKPFDFTKLKKAVTSVLEE
jgi:DNA-binding NtrC family response regulator